MKSIDFVPVIIFHSQQVRCVHHTQLNQGTCDLSIFYYPCCKNFAATTNNDTKSWQMRSFTLSLALLHKILQWLLVSMPIQKIPMYSGLETAAR